MERGSDVEIRRLSVEVWVMWYLNPAIWEAIAGTGACVQMGFSGG
jgi:hypothetical protein